MYAKVVRAQWTECKIFTKRPAKGLILLESRETFDSIPDMICVHTGPLPLREGESSQQLAMQPRIRCACPAGECQGFLEVEKHPTRM